VATTDETAAPDDATQTIVDLQPDPEAKVDLRRLPGIVRAGLRIVAATSRLELFTLQAAAYRDAPTRLDVA
jgi:hypothetical protein